MNLLNNLLEAAKQATTVTVTVEKEKSNTPRQTLNRIPEGLTIRLFPKTGLVYPSTELVALLSLEYKDKETMENEQAMFNLSQLSGKTIQYDVAKVKDFACGLDVIPTKGWLNYQNQDISLLYVAAVPRVAGRTDLFSSCKFVNDVYLAKQKADNQAVDLKLGQPITTVQEQGGNEYTKSGEFLEVICKAYGLNVEAMKTVEYIDLELKPEFALTQTDEQGKTIEAEFTKWVVNKKTARGEKAGSDLHITRYGITPMLLIPTNLEYLLTLEAPAIPSATTTIENEAEEIRLINEVLEVGGGSAIVEIESEATAAF
jgi:hypothetical protein